MTVYVPAGLEATEEVAKTPTAKVDNFTVEEGSPKGFPANHQKPEEEVDDAEH